jgi:cellulose synthase/poly-beta-1,6-N-acetylglucosamine synthase-like glycosyltransferase
MTPLNLGIVAIHGIVFYAWVLFPALLAWRSRKAGADPRPPASDALPRIGIILSAYNEETHISARIRNLLEMDYPADRWTALIGVDGAKDRTAAEARTAAAGHSQVEVIEFAENRGKVSVLKDLADRLGRDAPILVFTDANTDFEADALRRLVAPFSDKTVGGVCGKLVFVEAAGGKTGENVYWKLENWLKARESDIDSCLGANGAIYAIRASLFWNAIPSNTIIDDFVIGMKVREQGARMIYEPRAVAFEELPAHVDHEWKRRVRIGAGDFQALRLCAPCLGWRFGSFAWAFWSHKVLRWFTPHLALCGLALALAGGSSEAPGLGVFMLAVYATGAAAGFLGARLGNRAGAPGKLLRGIHYLLAMQAALFVGFLRFCRGNLEGRWQRTAR